MSHGHYKEPLSFERTDMYFTDQEDAPSGRKRSSERSQLLSDEPVDQMTASWEASPFFCIKNPPPWLRQVAFHLTRERLKIGIILIFVLIAAIMFAFSHEEDAEHM